MDLRIKKPESTPTRDATRPSEPEGTKDGDLDRLFQPPEESFGGGPPFDISLPPGPPKEALLNVVMTFVGGDVVRMEAVDIGVTVEGREAPTVYGRLIDAVSAYLEASGDERAQPLRHTPDHWFRFVPPDQATTGERRKTLTERLEDAYRNDALTPEEKGLLDDAANQFGSRLSDEE